MAKKIYSVVLQEQIETIALVSADNIGQAWEKARAGEYDLLPNTALTLPTRILKVTLSDLVGKFGNMPYR